MRGGLEQERSEANLGHAKSNKNAFKKKRKEVNVEVQSATLDVSVDGEAFKDLLLR